MKKTIIYKKKFEILIKIKQNLQIMKSVKKQTQIYLYQSIRNLKKNKKV